MHIAEQYNLCEKRSHISFYKRELTKIATNDVSLAPYSFTPKRQPSVNGVMDFIKTAMLINVSFTASV